MTIAKRFRFERHEWEVVKTGPRVPAQPGMMGGDWWPVTIRCVTEPSRSEIHGYMRDLDIEGVTPATFATWLERLQQSGGPAA